MLTSRIDIFPPERVRVGAADRVHREIESTPTLADSGKNRFEAPLLDDVALHNEVAAGALRERSHPLAERLTLIGEGQRSAMSMQRLCDPPGDRTLVGDTHDEALFIRHQRHRLPHLPICGDPTRRRAPRPLRVPRRVAHPPPPPS